MCAVFGFPDTPKVRCRAGCRILVDGAPERDARVAVGGFKGEVEVPCKLCHVLDAGEDADDGSEAVINAPSAAEVTAALAALSSDNETSDVTEAEADSADEAAAVAAELEAAAAAMAAPPSSSDSDDGDDDSKPSGWFEAQQNAEKAAKAETDDENEGGDPADEKS